MVSLLDVYCSNRAMRCRFCSAANSLESFSISFPRVASFPGVPGELGTNRFLFGKGRLRESGLEEPGFFSSAFWFFIFCLRILSCSTSRLEGRFFAASLMAFV